MRTGRISILNTEYVLTLWCTDLADEKTGSAVYLVASVTAN